MKEKIDEYQIYEKHYEQIHEQVKNDPYAQSLGIQLIKFEAGFAEATLEVQSHMVNAYGTVHGAVIYAVADHAFSVACNAYGKTSLGLSTTIQFIESASCRLSFPPLWRGASFSSKREAGQQPPPQ